MSKNYFVPGDEITAEEKERLRVALDEQEKDKVALIKKQDEIAAAKRDVDFMNVKFEPFEDRVLVYPDPVEEKTAGGLYKPEEAVNKVKPLIGIVVAVGPGKAGKYDSGERMSLPIERGERVVYGNYAGTEFTLHGIKYLIMRFTDIFGRALNT